MFETLFVFLSGMATAYLLTWPALIVLLVLGILFEHNGARGWAVFTGLVAIATSYFFFAVPFETLLVYAVGYIVVGLFWSFWRYKRFVEAEANTIRNLNVTDERKAEAARRLAPNNNLDTITAWILIWPFSAIENLLADVINAVQALVTKVFKGVYHRIYTSLVGDLINVTSK
mgnify:CR=1 FL=1